jgi:hypothetical protein
MMGEIIENVKHIYAMIRKSEEWGNVYTVDLEKPLEPKRVSDVVAVKISPSLVEKIELHTSHVRIDLKEAVSCEVVTSFGDNFIKCAKTKKELETIMI